MSSKTTSYDSYSCTMFKCFNRKFKINEAVPSTDIKGTFSIFAEGGDLMTTNQFRRFLVEHQGHVDLTSSNAEQIIREVIQRRNCDAQDKKIRPGLNLDEFFSFLFSDFNSPFQSEVHQDMTAPLSHYYIYTGHNSYLTGNQLSSDCSDAPIIKSLQAGVRVIELDLWPSSKEDVNVLHGRTLTTPVSLMKCLKSIKEYAFVKSPYPVIITLEDHLTKDLQAKVAEMVKDTFGDILYYPKDGCRAEFPSPESLKHKIIISTKPPKEYLESSSSKEVELIADLEDDDESDGDQEDEDNNESDSKSSQKEAPEYKRLIAIHAGKPSGRLKDSLKDVCGKVRRLSLSEQEMERAAATHGTDVVRFTHKNILRIYPKGTRVNSSNYNPAIAWIHGAQMVAFNMQGYGKSLWLMQGMFRANGGCGYVKKPDFLMTKCPKNEVFDPRKTLHVKKTLKVKIYLGDGWRNDFSPTHFDFYSPPDFYAKIHIVGVPSDSVKKKTRIIQDDWTPIWNEEFKFNLSVPELALLKIEVREYDTTDRDDFGGQTCLPIWEIKPGFRTLALFDKKGKKFNSVRLLMRFQFV